MGEYALRVISNAVSPECSKWSIGKENCRKHVFHSDKLFVLLLRAKTFYHRDDQHGKKARSIGIRYEMALLFDPFEYFW